MTSERHIALIGAGFIAPAHLRAVNAIKHARVSAIVDPNRERGEALAADAGGAAYFSSVDALLAGGTTGGGRPDAAHVLTPPPAHLTSAGPLLEAGIDVLLEKPMAQSPDECQALIAAAMRGDARLRINHNFVHHPTFVAARRRAQSGRYGRVRRVQMRYAAPLRQLTARQFGHWMFNAPRNLLLEQAVHPLSQIDALLGPISRCEVLPGPVRTPAPGIELVTDFMLTLIGQNGAAQVQIVLGALFPSWTLSILCDDGVVEADILAGRVTTHQPYASIPPIASFKRNLRQSIDAFAAGVSGIGRFGAELLRFQTASDGFSRSINASVAAFHQAPPGGPKIDPVGPRLVGLCHEISSDLPVSPVGPALTPAPAASYDVAVLGGTGFIGAHLVEALVNQGRRVAVMARSTANLPSIFHDPNVGVYSGSIGDKGRLDHILSRCGSTVNLAHGGGGPSRDAIARNMVDGAQNVADAAQSANHDRLIYVSSSAALYLGDPTEMITMLTPPDDAPDERGDYARAKILAEHAMMRVAADDDALSIAILRPAVVVGVGASPFHSALGAYENDTHCQGWNNGENPLPFVLVGDVVSAILAALDATRSEVSGRAFNLVGDVRWSARQYTAQLAVATQRPLAFHGSAEQLLLASEWFKWGVKKIAGRRGVIAPSARDLKSRGMTAPFDTSAEKGLLGWRPCDDETEFIARAINPHADAML